MAEQREVGAAVVMEVTDYGAPVPRENVTFEPNAWRDGTMMSNGGPIVVFYSENIPGHHANIGAIRLPEMSSYRISDYLAANYTPIKHMAIGYWQRFNSEMNNANGFGQKLVPDDFGLSFVFRHCDTSYSPDHRNEIGLWAADFPNLLSFSDLTSRLREPQGEYHGLVLYGHIYLYDEKKRRTVRAAEARRNANPAPAPNGKIGTHVVDPAPPTGPKRTVGLNKPRKDDKRPAKRTRPEAEPAQRQQDDFARMMKRACEYEEWKDKTFPALLKSKSAKTWPKDGPVLSPALPEC